MLTNFQLAAIVDSAETGLLRVPLRQDLQRSLAETWQKQLATFLGFEREIDFEAGYQPEDSERFRLLDLILPDFLRTEDSHSIQNLPAIPDQEEALASIRSLAGFAIDPGKGELILFQNFSPSHIIRPGWSIVLEGGTYKTIERPGITLGKKLCAVYFAAERKLLFSDFRTVNTFLPLADYYRGSIRD